MISEWWRERQLKEKLRESRAARARYLVILNMQSRIQKCSPKCKKLCEEKRKARIAYLVARVAYLEALVERKIYT